MATFQFKNKYDKITYLDFNQNDMAIREIGFNDQILEYNFEYSNIDKYDISRIGMGGIHTIARLVFYSNNDQIQKVENSNITYETTIAIEAGNYDIFSFYNVKEKDDENIRKIIHDNSPLRCDLDIQFDKKAELDRKYDLLAEETTG